MITTTLTQLNLKRYDDAPKPTTEREKFFTLANDMYFVTFEVYADVVRIRTDWSWDTHGLVTVPRDQARRIYRGLKDTGFTLYAGTL